MKLSQLIPNPADVIDLEPEEFAGILIPYLRGVAKSHRGMVNLMNVSGSSAFDGISQNHHEALETAIIEAWSWLENEGLLVPAPGGNGQHGWRTFSRRGQRVASPDGARGVSES